MKTKIQATTFCCKKKQTIKSLKSKKTLRKINREMTQMILKICSTIQKVEILVIFQMNSKELVTIKLIKSSNKSRIGDNLKTMNWNLLVLQGSRIHPKTVTDSNNSKRRNKLQQDHYLLGTHNHKEKSLEYNQKKFLILKYL